ncbi:hypothetical protein BW41_00290 [Sphingomonas sp. RIT328]|nr:hypothetical protein BW41_00290 [Sphingomonas sp. RIT328]
MKQKLDTQVAAAVGAMLVGCDEITLEQVAERLPGHIRAASPSLKSMTKALVSAGWIGERREGGSVVYVPPRPEGEGGENPRHNGFEGGAVAADEVRLLIERAERLVEERKGISDDIKDVWAEAKGRGYDPRALQDIMKLRAKKPEEQQERQAILEVYLRAMGMMA